MPLDAWALTPLVDSALANSPTLALAEARAERAAAGLRAAQAAYWPRISFQQDYGVSNSPVRTFMFKLHEAQFSLQENFNQPDIEGDLRSAVALEYDLYTGGAREASKRAAAARRFASEHRRLSARNTLVFRVTEAFYEVLRARDFVALQEATLERIATHLDIAQARFDAGAATRSDVLFVSVRRAEVREELVAARTRLALAWTALEHAVGAPVSRPPLPADIPVLADATGIGALEGCIAAALADRAGLQALENEADAAAAEVDAAKAGRYPRISAQASYDVHFDHDFSAHDDSFFVGLALRLDLLDGGRTASAVAGARARLREVQARRRQLVDDIELDVQQAYYRLQDARGRLTATAEAVRHADESLREVEVRYENGAATIVELVDAQTDFSSARLRQADSRAEVQIAAANLQRAVGGFEEQTAKLEALP